MGKVDHINQFYPLPFQDCISNILQRLFDVFLKEPGYGCFKYTSIITGLSSSFKPFNCSI